MVPEKIKQDSQVTCQFHTRVREGEGGDGGVGRALGSALLVHSGQKVSPGCAGYTPPEACA